ncbi:HesA/MoeB/ThiF family protein [Pedobacter sp. GR22-6]|uniref:HesA/MoeB/ThiF family protein n=1 Tax=Pedobacter sp. GR22-6 TaxID=3127957 RepID=UPI00307F637F
MEAAELKRYERQVILPELGLSGQLKLKKASVLIVGAGGLGCPVALYLAAAGVGCIGIVEHDVVEETNLQRQILFNITDLGKNKAEQAIRKLRLLNPYVNLKAYSLYLNQDNATKLISAYDLIIDASDNFPTRYLVNDTCLSLDKPLVFGSLFNFQGQVAVFNHLGSPDYRSLYPEPPLADEVPNCGENGVIGTLPGIIGSYMANEAIKVICGFGDTLAGKLLLFNALDSSSIILSMDQQVPKTELTYPELDLHSCTIFKNDPNYFLIDLREPYEYEEYNLGGTNIPLYELPGQLSHIPNDKKLILYCNTGYRSKIGFNLLKDNIKEEVFIVSIQPNI